MPSILKTLKLKVIRFYARVCLHSCDGCVCVVLTEEEEEGDGEPADPEAEAALLKELAELQAVRDRVTMLRQWLASGGQVDPSNPTSQALDALMMNVMQECADDPDSFSQVLTDRCVGCDCLCRNCSVADSVGLCHMLFAGCLVICRYPLN